MAIQQTIGTPILKEWFEDAEKESYAIPAFNYSDIWDLKAIIEAARTENARVILACNPLVVGEIGRQFVKALGAAATAEYPGVVHHLDHSSSAELCMWAIDAGYQSVMIDGSALPLDQNIALTREVVEYARPKGVVVEGELGRIKGHGIEGDFEGTDFLTRVDEAVRFVRETGVDSLAIGIGTAHGFYTHGPEINFERLREINEAVDVPLVLHGGTGIPRHDVERAIAGGIRKVNVGTVIHSTYMNALRQELNRLPESPYTLDVMKSIRPAVVDVVRQWINITGAAGKCNRR